MWDPTGATADKVNRHRRLPLALPAARRLDTVFGRQLSVDPTRQQFSELPFIHGPPRGLLD